MLTQSFCSDFTTLVKLNSAANGICEAVDDGSDAPTCEQVAAWASQVQQTCQSNGLVGGMFTISASQKIIVFNSKDAWIRYIRLNKIHLSHGFSVDCLL
jgi:hypothetical protein